MVSIEKMGAWYLLMLLSFVLTSLVHKPERMTEAAFGAAQPSQTREPAARAITSE
jgi:hypothetical protein